MTKPNLGMHVEDIRTEIAQREAERIHAEAVRRATSDAAWAQADRERSKASWDQHWAEEQKRADEFHSGKPAADADVKPDTEQKPAADSNAKPETKPDTKPAPAPDADKPAAKTTAVKDINQITPKDSASTIGKSFGKAYLEAAKSPIKGIPAIVKAEYKTGAAPGDEVAGKITGGRYPRTPGS